MSLNLSDILNKILNESVSNDAVNDVISVTINEGVIASTSNRDAATFTITNVDNAYKN